MNSLDPDTIPAVGAPLDSSEQIPNKQQLLSLGLEQSIPEFNIQLTEGWSAADWETKAASASLPYTPSYASFNSPGSNLSALSGDNDLDYRYNMDEQDHYNPHEYSTGAESFPLIDPTTTFGEADEFLPPATAQNNNPHVRITEPPQYSGSQSQYQNQPYSAHRATPEHSPSPASSAGEMEQRNFTGSATADGVGQPSPMMGNILPPAGFTEGLANLNFGGQLSTRPQSPPQTNANLAYYQRQVSRGATPITVPPNDESGSQHPSAGASSPGTPGSMSAQRPLIITESLSSPPLTSSASDGPSGGYLDPLSQQGDAPNILLIPSSPGEQHAQTTTQTQQSNPDGPPQQQPPGLQDFLSGGVSSSTLAGPPTPAHPWALGHRPRSHSHSDIVHLNQQNQMGASGMSYGSHLAASPYANAGQGTGVANSNVLTTTAPTARLGTWQDLNLYSGYSFNGQQVHKTVNPNEAFGGQQAPVGHSAFDGLLPMPPSPEHAAASLNALPNHSGMSSYPAPLLSITQPPTSSSMNATQSSPGTQQHSPAPSHSSASTAGPSFLQQQQATLAPPPWQASGGAMLRRFKTTGSANAFGHRRGAYSEGQNEFVRNIAADGTLLPPSAGPPSLPNSSNPSCSALMVGGDSLGLGLGGNYASSAASAYGADNEYTSLHGGAGPDRGRRRTSSAASERSPYHRPLSISPSRSPNFAQSTELYHPSGSVPNSSDMLPATSVERQHVTTPATEIASQSRRKNKAPFTCPVEGCGSTFTRQFNLKGHLRSHREERPYVCKWPKCGKGFARQHDCKRHEALHLNIRPFTCDGCGKTFARMDALNRHHKSEGGVECRHTTDLDGVNCSSGAASGGSGSEDAYCGGGSWDNSAYIA